MDGCICPNDYRAIPDSKRVWLIEPQAVVGKHKGRVVPGPGVHVVHADCPEHGYSVLEKDEP